MQQVSISEAKKEFCELVNETTNGKSITITKEGKPVAVLAPYNPPPKQKKVRYSTNFNIPYDFNELSLVGLYQSLIQVKTCGRSYEGTLYVSLENKRFSFIKLQVKLHISPEDVQYFENYDGIEVLYNNKILDVLVTNCRGNNLNGECIMTCLPIVDPFQIIGDDDTILSSVEYVYINVVNFCYSMKKIKSRGWIVEIYPVDDIGEIERQIKNESVYAVTHCVKVKKENGTSFSGREFIDFIDELNYFLFFAFGKRHVPICPVGFDSAGRLIWERWSSPSDTTQHFYGTWFSRCHFEQLAMLFPLFSEKWNSGWKETLQTVLSWYIQINDITMGIDTCILLTQASFERLIYEFNTKLRPELDNKPAVKVDKQIKEFFHHVGIPEEIPAQLSNLKKYSSFSNAMVRARGNIVHPQNQFFDHEEIAELYRLVVWGLELSILAICDYSGTYGNRLNHRRFENEVEIVPWAKADALP